MLNKLTSFAESIKASKASADFQEINFKDLLNLFINIKKFVFFGVIAGILAGGVAAYRLGKEGYYTRFYLKADYTKFPAMENQKEVSDLLNKLFYSLYGAEIIYKTITNPDEAFNSTLDVQKIAKEDFILSLSEHHSNYSFKLAGLDAMDEYMLDVILPVSGLNQDRIDVIQKALNELVYNYNSQLKQNYQTKKSNRLEQITSDYDVAESAYSKSALDIFGQIQKFRQEMIDIEYKLISRLPADIKLKNKDFLNGGFDEGTHQKVIIPVDLHTNVQNSAPVDSIRDNIKSILQKDIDRMIRIATLLKDSNHKLNSSVQDEINRIYDIQKEIAAIDNGKKIAEAKIAMQSSMMNLEKVGILVGESFDESKVFLPHFDLNKTLIPSKESNTSFEVITSNRLNFFIKTFLAVLAIFMFAGLLWASYVRGRLDKEKGASFSDT